MDLKKTIREVTLEGVADQARRVGLVLEHIRGEMLSPDSEKHAPIFRVSDISELCSVDRSQINYRLTRGDLPHGVVNGARREWTLTEARQWVRALRPDRLKPSMSRAVTIAIANSKGGVTKTTTAITLAQGLALRGHKVLVIDLDPQATATTLLGYRIGAEVQDEHTALPLFIGDEELVDYAIRPTYFDGIDVVSAAPLLFGAEFALPARQRDDPGFEFWNTLSDGLDMAVREYDVIIIDTAPALSFVTINALIAADGVIMPMPPSSLDFASSAQFWDLFSDLVGGLYKKTDMASWKVFEFMDVLLAKVDSNNASSTVVRQWISAAYGDKVLPIEIPVTSVAANAATEFGTVYDVQRGQISPKTYQRAKAAYDRFVELVEEQIRGVWQKQADQAKEILK